jgi:hypothetical protein
MAIRRIFIYASVLLTCSVLGANVYNSVVDAPNWGASIPDSLDTAKQYFAVADPGTFFRAVAPAAQVAALLSLIAAWPAGRNARILAGAALLLTIFGDVLTFAYFYPRNALMFGPAAQPTEVLRDAWSGWSATNHFRSVVILASVICELSVLSAFEGFAARR